jgi:hypothetical protein
MVRTIRALLAEDGFTVIRGLLGSSGVASCILHLQRLADSAESWTEPDGVSRHSEFWPVIFNERLVGAVSEIFGPTVRYLPVTVARLFK